MQALLQQQQQQHAARRSCRASASTSARALPAAAVVPRAAEPVQPAMMIVPSIPSSSCHHRRRAVSAKASKLGDVSLFSSDSNSLLGGPAMAEDTKGKAKVEDVPLESEVGMDYTALRDHLKAGDFRKADDETRALLIRLAGEGAVKRGWVYFTEVSMIGAKDLITMDELWKAASNGKFGYSVQREMFTQSQRRWPKFFKQIDWTQGENNVYRKWPMEFIYSMDAPKGHLPLTNALRGTQLFEALFKHPAWEQQAAAKGKKRSIDDSAKEAGANTLKW